MLNFSQIYEGWRNNLVPPAKLKEKIEAVKKERLRICEGCSYYSENRKKTGKWTTARPDVHCTHCGCTLSAKTACLSCACPINRWKALTSEAQEEEINKETENGQQG